MATMTYDFSYRPTTYWDTPDALLANIKGERRRQVIQQALKLGTVAQLDRWLLKEKLSLGERELLTRIHPVLMGGEYLPDYAPTQVEIARVALRSTTGDVISLRARRTRTGIRYHFMDEYESKFVYSPKTTRQPLTFGQLVGMIDTVENVSMEYTGLTDSLRDQNDLDELDPERLLDFVTVSSPFYPQLQRYYDEQARLRLVRALQRRAHGDGDGDARP